MEALALQRLSHRWPRASYGARFAVLSGVAAAVAVLAGPVENLLRDLTEWAVAQAVPWVGLTAWAQPEDVVIFQRGGRAFAYSIVSECAGLKVVLLYAAAVSAYRFDMRRRLTGIVVGAMMLMIANLMRLISLAAIGVYKPTWFAPVHEVGWPIFQIGGIVVMTLCWSQWARSALRPTGVTLWRLPSRRPAFLCALFSAFLVTGLMAGIHRAYVRVLLAPLSPIAALLWQAPVTFYAPDPELYARTRFSSLVVALAIVVAAHPPHRVAGRTVRTAGLVLAVQLIGSIAEGLLAAPRAPAEGVFGASEGAIALVAAIELGLIVLIVLHQANGRRAKFR